MTPLTSKICRPVSVFTKPAPVGVDVAIQGFQTALYPQLLKVWGLPDAGPSDTDAATRWDSYGRAYRNQTEDGYAPEAFIGDTTTNLEYQELYFSDKLAVTSFFLLDATTKYKKTTATAPVAWIFTMDLKKVKPAFIGQPYRADEEVRNDVMRLARLPRYDMVLEDVIVGIDNVFKEFAGWKKDAGIKFRDMQPRHCFRFNFSLIYNPNACYSPIKNFQT